MPAITLSAPYGAGGSQVGPAVAERLGLTFLDRAISSTVAEELDVSVEEAESGALHRTWLERMAFSMSPFAPELVAAGAALDAPMDEQALRHSAEGVLRDAAQRGAVVLGRAGAWALAEQPGVLRVRLYGHPERRVRQARQVEGVDEATARRRLEQVDKARAEYVRRLYGAKVDDPDVYDLQVDSTLVPLDVVVELIVTAARPVLAQPSSSTA